MAAFDEKAKELLEAIEKPKNELAESLLTTFLKTGFGEEAM